MTRWTRLYDELAGPRYPALLAYAGLLTDDTQTADALVAAALRRTFVRPRRLAGLGQAERETRQAIVADFLAREKTSHGTRAASPARARDLPADEPSIEVVDGARARSDSTAADGSVDGDRRAQSEPRTSPYAPPAPDDQTADDRAADANRDEPGTDHGDDEHSPPRASAGARGDVHAEPVTSADEADEGMSRDERQLRATLRRLAPQARVIAVLRYHDGLTPGQICERLALPMDTVLPVLHEVRDIVRTHLGIVVADDVLEALGAGGSEIAVADHAGRP